MAKFAVVGEGQDDYFEELAIVANRSRAPSAVLGAPPDNVVVLSIDEKTGIQAKSREYPTQPLQLVRPERREVEYVRHGTATLTIHVVLDNGSSHRSKATKKLLAEHPRFVVHHTPVHTSWLNQVEAFFSILTRRVLGRGGFGSRLILSSG